MKHGMSGTRFYQIWSAMQQRCYYPKHNRFSSYGGRGIKCEWKCFEDFKRDMYDSYLEHVKKHGEKNTSIDRKSSDGHYSKKNCKWNTHGNQNLNRTNNFLITYKGITKPIAQWSREYGFKRGVIEGRLDRLWSMDAIFNTPVIIKFRHKNHDRK